MKRILLFIAFIALVAVQVSALPPTIASLSPTTANVGGPAFLLLVTGTNYTSDCQVEWAGAARTTSCLSGTQLQAMITGTDLSTAGTFPITVTNTTSVETSPAVNFVVANFGPVITAASPAFVLAGAPEFELALTGTGFAPGSTVQFAGAAMATIAVNTTRINATIPASYLTAPLATTVKVFTPGPGGGESNAFPFEIRNPTPTLTSINPATVIAGSPTITLQATGTGFISTSVITWQGKSMATVFVSGTLLNATIPASGMAKGKRAVLAVTNPGPGGGTTPTLTCVVNNPTPVLTSISPATVKAGKSTLLVTLTGAQFNRDSKVLVNGKTRTTRYVSTTSLTVRLTKSDLATPGSVGIRVTNPHPGGGLSGTQTLKITK
jgi:hypothetical protein